MIPRGWSRLVVQHETDATATLLLGGAPLRPGEDLDVLVRLRDTPAEIGVVPVTTRFQAARVGEHGEHLVVVELTVATALASGTTVGQLELPAHTLFRRPPLTAVRARGGAR